MSICTYKVSITGSDSARERTSSALISAALSDRPLADWDRQPYGSQPLHAQANLYASRLKEAIEKTFSDNGEDEKKGALGTEMLQVLNPELLSRSSRRQFTLDSRVGQGGDITLSLPEPESVGVSPGSIPLWGPDNQGSSIDVYEAYMRGKRNNAS